MHVELKLVELIGQICCLPCIKMWYTRYNALLNIASELVTSRCDDNSGSKHDIRMAYQAIKSVLLNTLYTACNSMYVEFKLVGLIGQMCCLPCIKMWYTR